MKYKLMASIKSKGKYITLRHQPVMSNPFSSEMDIGFDYMNRKGHVQFLFFDGHGEGMYKNLSRSAINHEAQKIINDGEQDVYKVHDDHDEERKDSIGYIAVDKSENSREIVRDYLYRYLAYKYDKTYSLTIGSMRYNWLIDKDIRKIIGRFNAWRLFRQF